MRYRRIIIFPGDGRYAASDSETPGTIGKRRNWVHLILFLLTVFTTTMVGSFMEGKDPFGSLGGFAAGFPFSITIMSILGVHELAHYFAGKKWGIDVTLPYFLPAPFPPIGTFGAVIRLKSSIPNRRALVDLGVSGPLAGFVLAVIASMVGLSMSEVVPIQGREDMALTLGESLLFKLLGWIMVGPLPEGQDIMLSSIGFAGWIGLFVTALNLMPFGQLDGGHVLFALSPRLHELIRRIRVPLLLLLGISLWNGWYVWAVLLFFLGGPHPYPDSMDQRLGVWRTVLAIAAIVVFVLCIMPSPVKVG